MPHLDPAALSLAIALTHALPEGSVEIDFDAGTSLRAGREYLGGVRGFGEQQETIAQTKIWILPSTSGAANGSWRPEVWHAFAKAVQGARRD